MNGMSPLLEVRNLVIRRNGSVFLDIPELKIFHGQTLAVIGPNGSGKTTLLRALTHLVEFESGEILFRGERITPGKGVHEHRRKTVLVFQDPVLLDTTVYANIASGLKIRGMRKKTIDAVVDLQLERFGIAHLKKRNAKTLSGGEAHRTSLARAFALEPDVLLLDEPFSSLDVKAREALMDDLEKALRDTGTCTVFTTHDRLEAFRLADRIVILSGGRIVQEGSPREIMLNPVNEFVAAYAGVEILLSGEVRSSDSDSFVVEVSGKGIEVAGNAFPGERITIGLRPENIMLSTEPGGRISARNTFRGSITRIIPMGYHYRVCVDCGFNLISHVTGHSIDSLSLTEGMEITVFFKATSVHIIRRDI